MGRWAGRLAAALLAALAGLVLAGPAVAAPREPTPPARYVEQGIVWKPCWAAGQMPHDLPEGSARLRCGTFAAPRDWADPDAGPDVTIAVSRLAPDGPVERSLLTNPGGPGAPGLAMPLALLGAGRARVLATAEVIGMDVRGTGRSSNLSCGGESEAGSALDVRDRGAGNVGLLLAAAETIARFCQGASGDLGPFVTTEQTVRDLDLLRRLLGRERIDFLGGSAGAWLGAYYATYFPEHVGRFVLDSVPEFTATWQQVFGRQAAGAQRRYEVDFLPWVAAHDDLFHLGTTPQAVNGTYEAVRAALAARPLGLIDGSVARPGDVDVLLGGAMYDKRAFQPAARQLGLLRHLLAERDGQAPATPAPAAAAAAAGLARARVRAARLLEPGAGSDADDATMMAIRCNDTPYVGGPVQAIAESARQGESNPLVGWYRIVEPCAFWRRPPVELRRPTGEGSPPILLVQNERDPATPIEGALAAKQGFAGARMVTVLGEGDHGAYAHGNDCVDRKVESFLVDGAVPAGDETCPGQPLPTPETGLPSPVGPPQPGAAEGLLLSALDLAWRAGLAAPPRARP